LCSITETASVQSNLDISILGNELDTAVKTPNASSDDTDYALHNNVFGSETFIFLDEVLENSFEQGGHCDQH